MKKKPFLLLEILIAFLLVAVCAVPLVTQPLKLYRAEMKFLEQMERERLANWTFSELKEKLLKNEIPWGKIPQKGMKGQPIPLPPAFIQIPGCAPKKVERTFTLMCKGEKKGLKEEIYRLLYVRIDFSPRLFPKKKEKKSADYGFRVIVQKLPAPQG